MIKTILNIEGMTCSACSNGLEKYLNKQDGIKSASVNLILATALIEHEENITIDDLNRYVEEAGFKSLGKENKKEKNLSELRKIFFYSFLIIFLMYISMGNMIKIPIPDLINKSINPRINSVLLLILTIPFIIYGIDIIKNGIKNIVHRMPNMDSLVGIGIIVNFLFSIWNVIQIFGGNLQAANNLYFEASCMIVLFVKIGRYIDKENKHRAIESIQNLVTITPQYGVILNEGKEITVTINEINKGDIVICKPGEKIAVDGTIIKGSTHTDESFITGESKPVSKKEGDMVIAGSVNYDGYIEYSAEKIGKNSSISHIVDLVVEATNTKPPIARFTDKVCNYFVPTIFILAILSLLLNLFLKSDLGIAVKSFVSVLVVACPCALGLATPLAMVISIGKCSKKGILIKSSSILESINKIDTVVFDKTGTLTTGKLEIVNSDISKNSMHILIALEKNSNHPIAKSIVEAGTKYGFKYEVNDFENNPGYGVSGVIDGKKYYAGNRKYVDKVIKNSSNINVDNYNIFKDIEEKYLNENNTIVFLFDEKEVLGIIGLKDDIKKDTQKTIKELKKQNKKIVILTGDNEDSAKIIADKLEIDNLYANTNPKEKLELIKKLNINNNCMMVGDGINDSPALKTATIGVSVHGGTDIASDSSDIILLSNDMSSICESFSIGKKTMRIIKQNLFWALFYNICMIPLATGLLSVTINPMISSAAMVLSSLTVVFNSLRLLR